MKITKTFDVELATKYGTDVAMLMGYVFDNIKIGIKGRDNEFYDFDRRSYYNCFFTSIKRIHRELPFISMANIRIMLEDLIENNLLIGVCNYEKCTLSAYEFIVEDLVMEWDGTPFIAPTKIMIRDKEAREEMIEKSRGIMDRETIGYIYVVISVDKYKIGITSQPEKRMYSLEQQTPEGISVLLCEQVYEYRYLEKKLHKFFEIDRHKGEWFTLGRGEEDLIHYFIKPYLINENRIDIKIDADPYKKFIKE